MSAQRTLPAWAVSQYPSAPVPVLACANRQWKADMERAREIDRMAVRDHGQRDVCHHFCAEQRSQQRRGYMCIRISQNIYGWCVRDTMNDGMGNMSGNGDAQFAAEWAVAYWARNPDRVDVFVWPDNSNPWELVDALNAAIAKLAPVDTRDPDIRQGRYSPDDNFIFPGRS